MQSATEGDTLPHLYCSDEVRPRAAADTATAALMPATRKQQRQNGEIADDQKLTLSVLTQREGAENNRVILVHATSDSGGELRRRR